MCTELSYHGAQEVKCEARAAYEIVEPEKRKGEYVCAACYVLHLQEDFMKLVTRTPGPKNDEKRDELQHYGDMPEGVAATPRPLGPAEQLIELDNFISKTFPKEHPKHSETLVRFAMRVMNKQLEDIQTMRGYMEEVSSVVSEYEDL